MRREELTAIYPTHHGRTTAVDVQLDGLDAALDEASNFVHEMLNEQIPRQQMVSRYEDWMRSRAADAGVDDETYRSFEAANPREMSVDGIVRYWQKLERS